MAELLTLLSKGQMNSLKKNAAVQALAGMDQEYKYGVTYSGFVQLELYAGYSEGGKLSPIRMLQVTLDPRKVIKVDRYFKDPGTSTWKHLG